MKPTKLPRGIDEHQLASFLRGVELLNGLSTEDLVRVAQTCQIVRFRRAERIFTESQPGACLYVVMSGRVKIFGSSAQGRSKTFAYLEPGDFFGEMSLIDEEVRSASASALDDSVLIMLKADDYRKLMLSRPAIALAVLKTMSTRLRKANKEIEALSFNNVLGRIAQILLDLSERYGKKTDEGTQISMTLSHKELAEMAGTAREVISRVISRFRRMDCIRFADNKLTVTDREKLEELDFLMTIQVPKGTRDLTGAEVVAFWALEKAARHIFELYEFEELRTPIFESAELFTRSLGETSDVVEKEMFTFTDRGERTFSLRPEGTAGVVRHFVENNLAAKGGLQRFFYIGPMFRAERPQAGRYRQFSQIGSEYFGAGDAAADAETVIMVSQILRAFGIADFTVNVNSLGDSECRPRYRDALLSYLKKRAGDLTEESRRRMQTNPLRVLDSKVDGPKLSDAPVLLDYLNDDCREHHALFLRLLKDANIPFQENPRLVRGLDYYTRSVFEFVSPHLGAQSALAAGGRYDDLVALLGGPKTPAVGFALGMDRLVAARPASVPGVSTAPMKAIVIPFMAEAAPACVRVAQSLRADGVAVPPVAVGKKLKTQLAHAVDSGANWAILIGEDELKTQTASVKNLATREQSSVSLDGVAEHIKTIGGR